MRCQSTLWRLRLQGDNPSSPATFSLADYNGLALEFELAVRFGKDVPTDAAPFDENSIRDYVGACYPAFELIDDRRADYSTLDAISMLTDNIWCGGVVLGPEVGDWQNIDMTSNPVHLTYNGERAKESNTGAAMGSPMISLAWLANLAMERGWPMREGMIVITGSTLATIPQSRAIMRSTPSRGWVTSRFEFQTKVRLPDAKPDPVHPSKARK